MIGNRRKPIIIHWTNEEMCDEGNLRPKVSKFNACKKISTGKPQNLKKHEEKTDSESYKQSHESASGASLKELCAEDKKRVANLVRELARLEDEKTAMVKVVEEERARFEQQMNELMQQQQQSKLERDMIQKQLMECQELITKYHISDQQQQKSVQSAEGKRGGRTVGDNKQKHHSNRHRRASIKSDSESCSSGNDSNEQAVKERRHTKKHKHSGQKRSAREERGQGHGARRQQRGQSAVDSQVASDREIKDEAGAFSEYLWPRNLPVSARTKQLLAEADVLHDRYGNRASAGDAAVQVAKARFAADSEQEKLYNNEKLPLKTDCDKEFAAPAPRSENSYIVRAAHIVESNRPFTEVLDRMIAEQNADMTEKSLQQQQQQSHGQALDLNRRLAVESYLPEVDIARTSYAYNQPVDRLGEVSESVDRTTSVHGGVAATSAYGVGGVAGGVTAQQGVGGPMGAPSMTSTLRDNERMVSDTAAAAVEGSVASRLARDEMARQREALMAEQQRLKEVLAEQELLLQHKQQELRVQQEMHRQRLQVFEDTGLFPLARDPRLMAPSIAGMAVGSVLSARLAAGTSAGLPISNAENGHQSAGVQHSSVQTTPKKSAKAAMQDTATSPLKSVETSHKPNVNAKRGVVPRYESETSLVDLINEVESEYSYYSDRGQLSNHDHLNLNVHHCSHNNKCGSDCSCSELEESSLLEQVFFYK